MGMTSEATRPVQLIMFGLTVAGCLVGVWWYIQPTPTEHIVEFHATYYEPATLTIDPGDTVTFVNLAPHAMWPASDSHPTHLLYSDFDPKMEVAAGERWSFTFTESGSYPYHDHLLPYIQGTIVVR